MQKLTIAFLTMLLTVSPVLAKPRKPIQRYNNPVAMPEDPQAYAERIARQTWPGRALCDDGGYRIRPCDLSRGGP
jgi:hypothetical protein